MRALFVSNLLPPDALGGYESVCADVADRWRRDGHEVAVLTSPPRRPGVADDDPPGVHRDLPLTHLHAAVAPWWRRPAMERRARSVVDDVIDRTDPEIGVIWNVAGLPFGAIRRIRERGVPLLLVVGDNWPGFVPRGDPWIAPFRGGVARRVLGAVGSLVSGVPTTTPPWSTLGSWAFSSSSLRRQVQDVTGEAFHGSCVVPHGIDPVHFPVTTSGRSEPWRWRLLFVGRLDQTKGIDTLVRALPLLPPEATLEVCAPPEAVHLRRVEQLVRTLDLEARVRIGSVERARLRERYRAADVCVFPSEWEEPFGLVPIESMACGTPVVASGTGGSAEFLHDGGNCVLAAPRQPAAIAEAVAQLAADPGLRARLVDGGRATAAELTVDRLAERLSVLAAELVSDR